MSRIGFDLDGTLVKYGLRRGETPIVNHKLIDQLMRPGDEIVIITNQGGLGFAKDTNDYPMADDIVARLLSVNRAIEQRWEGAGVTALWACTGHDKLPQDKARDAAIELMNSMETGALMGDFLTSEYNIFFDRTMRKPDPRMLQWSGVVAFIGDSDEDEQAAAAAGIPFRRVDRFMGGGQ